MNNAAIVVLVIALIIVICIAVWLYMQKRRTQTLQSDFGPEYDRAVHEHHGQREAEQELEKRRERVEHLHIQPLPRAERDRFAERWQSVQAQFVDDPNGALRDADELVGQVMQTRGYPVGDFEQRAADVSVNHPGVVEHYRAAHAIAVRNERGGVESSVETEDLRQAMVHFRALFEDLLEVDTSDTNTRNSSMEARR
jgi:FtsZ-interacting cell division protein ZipA